MFYESPESVDAFLDGKAANEFSDYFDQWGLLKIKLDTAIEENNKLRDDLQKGTISLAKINADITARQSEISALDVEISGLNDQIKTVNSYIANPSSFQAQIAIGLDQQAFFTRIGIRPDIKYDPKDDFLRKVLEADTVSIKGKPYDSNQISNKVLNKELVDALDGLTSDPKATKALKDIGIDNLKLASAGRTPLQQDALRSTTSKATGTFSSGHIFGVSGDIAVEGTNYNDAVSHDKLKSILGEHGITLPDSLKIKDPNTFS